MPDTPVRNIDKDSEFKDRLIKLIPGEVVAAYMAIDGIIPAEGQSSHSKTMAIIVSIVLLVAIPFYLKRVYSVVNTRQIVFTMGTFIVWLYSLGGPFKYFHGADGGTIHVPWMGSIFLILWTLFIPFAVTPAADPAPAPPNPPPAGG